MAGHGDEILDLVKELHQKADRAKEREEETNRRLIEAERQAAADRLTLIAVITREGKGGRVYEDTETGIAHAISTIGPWKLENVDEPTVNILQDRGICQSWGERKKLNHAEFGQFLRFYATLATSA